VTGLRPHERWPGVDHSKYRCLACGWWVGWPTPDGDEACRCMAGRVVVFMWMGRALFGVCVSNEFVLRIRTKRREYTIERGAVIAVVVGTGRPVTTVVRDYFDDV
jgi:hypothetical protein